MNKIDSDLIEMVRESVKNAINEMQGDDKEHYDVIYRFLQTLIKQEPDLLIQLMAISDVRLLKIDEKSITSSLTMH